MLKRLLAPLASLRLAVVLMGLSMLLIYAGTWAQVDTGIWDVQKKFFHSFFAWIDFRTFFPRPKPGEFRIPGGFPMPGGYTLGMLLLVNLLAAHFVRFKFSSKRIGVILIHLGLILLLVGEGITSGAAVESQMQIMNGQSANYSQDTRAVELAVIDPSPADADNVVVINKALLQSGKSIRDSRLPFEIHIDNYFPNSNILGPFQAGPRARPTSFGRGATLTAVQLPITSGVDEDSADYASAYLTFSANGERLGTCLVSQVIFEIPGKEQRFDRIGPQEIKIGDKTYLIELRYKRLYKPYTIQLLKFSHDTYTGTGIAKNFASQIRLIDPARGEDREVKIWMNNPLRYNGETFYQQRFLPGDSGTVLQIVSNPAWTMPYIACTIGGVGMLIHFGMHLMNFLAKRNKPAIAQMKASKSRSNEKSYSLAPRRWWTEPSFVVASVVTIICGMKLLGAVHQAESGKAPEFDSFSRIPVSYRGRVQPLDSAARNAMKLMANGETFPVQSDRSWLMLQLRGPKRAEAIEWMAPAMAGVESTDKQTVLKIDYSDILGQMQLDPQRKYYSPIELLKDSDKTEKLRQQISYVFQLREAKRPMDLYQNRLAELGDKLMAYEAFSTKVGALHLVPPSRFGDDWEPIGKVVREAKETGVRNTYADTFVGILDYIHAGDMESFKQSSEDYIKLLRHKMPETMAKVEFEVFFNRFDPFSQCMALYIIAFVFTCCSWLFWTKPLARSAFYLLVMALVVHTLALAGRIYISGRPPVTNLASSAIFIAWGAVFLSVVLERIFKNGVGTVTAAIVGFVSLLIHDRLALNGDTMEVLVAVLDTNFWLWTHVPCVVIGYAATFLAGFLGIVYIIRGIATTSLTPDESKEMSRMIYGVLCFATLFSFVGTILGGIWADQSWGRFWGWDPKENGAVLIVLWNAIALHCRWAGLVRQRGLACLAIFGNIVTSWSWFGTNMLGVGLHSYGFMSTALQYLLAFVASQLLLIAIGNLPLNRWRSPVQG